MKLFSVLLSLSLVLAACSATPRPAATFEHSDTQLTPARQPHIMATSSPTPAITEVSPLNNDTNDQPYVTENLARIDEQGAVAIQATPVNLTGPGETLEFEVELNTHSVDLSMDLAGLATLVTDNGRTVPASRWDAPRGGHHVSGTLIFPATIDGQPVLDGAKTVTLLIKDLDAPERSFSWGLVQ